MKGQKKKKKRNTFQPFRLGHCSISVVSLPEHQLIIGWTLWDITPVCIGWNGILYIFVFPNYCFRVFSHQPNETRVRKLLL